MADKPLLDIVLCSPRGFCAGVDRAVQIVELALAKYGAPVYVRHEIVHNRFVVESLKAEGAVFIEELDEIADRSRPVIFSAHGVAKSVPVAADALKLFWLDATCPLVTKVHREAEIHHKHGRHVLLIGHAGHPEVIGTMGQLPDGAVTLVTSGTDAEAVMPPDGPLSYTTQTTLSLDDTAGIVAILQRRFPEIVSPHKQDICYATTNRQEAVKAVAPQVEAMIVVGAPNSSNSQRLREVAEREGCGLAVLVQRAEDLDLEAFAGLTRIGITAGASAPEVLVEEVIARFETRWTVRVKVSVTAEETVAFNLPRELRDVAGTVASKLLGRARDDAAE